MFDRFRKKDMEPSGAPEFLIVGLGNPGAKYEGTRHNIGFICVDLLAQKHDFKIKNLKFKSLYADVRLCGHRCLVMKPQTFMNNSGISVREAAQFYKIPPQNIIIIFDDISLPPGRLRIRAKGSAGGHNGLKSIIYHLNSDEFPRVKIGVGDRPDHSSDLAGWVLSGFSKDDVPLVKDALDRACEALETIVDSGAYEAMNKFN